MMTLLSAIKTLSNGVIDLVFPLVCLHCDAPLPAGTGQPFCQKCHNQLQQLLGDQCPRCAARFPTMDANAVNCPHCEDDDFAFTQSLCWGPYDSVLRSIVIRIKDQSNEALAHHMGILFARQFQDKLQNTPIDAIVPVPLHWTRRLWRGYNQSETLARAIAQELKKPYRSHWLWRQLQTPHQSTVTPHQRRKNLRQAMTARIPKPFQGQNLMLVDDVMTTGATADSCARALIQAGATTVIIVVLARALGTTATPGNFRSL